MYHLVIVIILTLLACNGPGDPGKTVIPDVLPPGTITGKTYHNPTLKFRFTVPEKWKFITNQKKLKVLAAAIKDTDDLELKDLVTVRWEDKFGPGTVIEKFDGMIKGIRTFFKNYEVVRKETVTVGGRPAGLLISSFTGSISEVTGEHTERQRLYLIPHHGRDITFDFTEPDSSDVQLKAEIEYIVNSIELY